MHIRTLSCAVARGVRAFVAGVGARVRNGTGFFVTVARSLIGVFQKSWLDRVARGKERVRHWRDQKGNSPKFISVG